MRNKKRVIKKLLNIICIFFALGCLIYGVGSITYANTNTEVPDLVITYDSNGKSKAEGSILGNELWYPGKEKNGIIRINNSFRKIKIEDLGLDIEINQFNPEYNKDMVYNSFINNFKLTIKKDNFILDDAITNGESLANIIKEGIDLDTIGSVDLNYTVKMDEAAGKELQSVIANLNFTINAKSDEILDDENGGGDGDNGGNNGDPNNNNNNNNNKLETFDGGLIDRMPGYVTLNKSTKIDEVKEEIVLPFNIEILRANGGHTARIYYWNESVEKWIALATYPNTPYTVKAINDGDYTGWFNVFGVIQPNFNDLILGHWAEPVTNRMNGLGIIEGYPGDGLIRPAQLEQPITRTEFTTLIYRLLNINPDRQILESYSLEEAKIILAENYLDAEEIPDWAAVVIASTTKTNLVDTREGKFLGNEPITRLEAAETIRKAFAILEKYQHVDLSTFIDNQDLPSWVKFAIDKNVIGKNSSNIYKLDEYITRADALTVLKSLFIIEMGL